jgi:uncharacterized membrane protein
MIKMSAEKSEPGKETCQICHSQKSRANLIPFDSIRPSIAAMILKEHPDCSATGFICMTDLNHYRMNHIQELLTIERGELSGIEADVVRSLSDEQLISQNLNDQYDQSVPLGARIADKVAEFGGSWRFIILFGLFILIWIIFNSIALIFRSFDPYPFILLNLILSCLAAIQAPIIMMSQNRQESKDRLRSEHDYKVNLKAEIEIRLMHEKIDHLLNHQWQSLLETQQLIMDMLNEMNEKK